MYRIAGSTLHEWLHLWRQIKSLAPRPHAVVGSWNYAPASAPDPAASTRAEPWTREPLGDWLGVELRVVGAVEQTEDSGLTAAQCQWLGSGYGSTADASPWWAPGARTLLYDPRRQHPAFAIPGSFLPANIAAAGVAGAARRDAARQARATGGYGLLRLTQQTGRREARPALALAAMPPLPPAPPPLPR